MMQPMQPPSRMRYSIEWRCKMVGLMLGGMGLQAARRLRRAAGDWVSAVAALPRGRVGGAG